MIGRILCRLGIHDWMEIGEEARECRRCAKHQRWTGDEYVDAPRWYEANPSPWSAVLADAKARQARNRAFEKGLAVLAEHGLISDGKATVDIYRGGFEGHCGVLRPLHGEDEGATCNRDGCEGVLGIEQEPCHCLVTHAPCSNCMNSWLECPVCGWRSDEDD